jgi:hypothetical protein
MAPPTLAPPSCAGEPTEVARGESANRRMTNLVEKDSAASTTRPPEVEGTKDDFERASRGPQQHRYEISDLRAAPCHFLIS